MTITTVVEIWRGLVQGIYPFDSTFTATKYVREHILSDYRSDLESEFATYKEYSDNNDLVDYMYSDLDRDIATPEAFLDALLDTGSDGISLGTDVEWHIDTSDLATEKRAMVSWCLADIEDYVQQRIYDTDSEEEAAKLKALSNEELLSFLDDSSCTIADDMVERGWDSIDILFRDWFEERTSR